MQKKKRLHPTWTLLALAALAACGGGEGAPDGLLGTTQQALLCSIDEFTQIPSWRSITDATYGPLVTGSDITSALQQAVQDIGNASSTNPTIFIPAGAWTINQTITVPGGHGINIVGADPATTTITWMRTIPVSDADPLADMFHLIDVGDMKLSRLTLDGNGNARAGIKLIQSACYKTVDKTACPLPVPWNVGKTVATTRTEFNDNVLKNMRYGIVVGERTRNNDDNQEIPLPSGIPLSPGEDNIGDILVRRVRFNSITQQGIEIWNQESINWLIADSEFSSCYRGIQVISGGVVVINNRFTGNGFDPDCMAIPAPPPASPPSSACGHVNGMDIAIAGGNPQVIRGNASAGSKQFLSISAVGGLGAADVSGNYISAAPPANYPAWPVIRAGDAQLTLFDNYIESTQSAPIAVYTQPPIGNGTPLDHDRITHGGNSFRTSNTVNCNTDCTPKAGPGTCTFLLAQDSANPLSGSIAQEVSTGDDMCASAAAIPAQALEANGSAQTPVAPGPSGRMFTDVNSITGVTAACGWPPSPPTGCGFLISDWLAQQKAASTKPFLYFPPNKDGYFIDQTIVVPANFDVVIAGDGANTLLFWNGTDTTVTDPYMFRLNGPSLASIRDLLGNVRRPATTRAGGILVESSDTSNDFVFVDSFGASRAKSLIDMVGLDNVLVRADLTSGGNLERMLGVIGGGKASPSQPAPGGVAPTKGVRMFAGGGGALTSLIDLKNWGKAVLVGTDNEQTTAGIVLNQSGYLTLNNGRFFPKLVDLASSAYYPDQENIVVQSTFRGRATFMDLTSISGTIVATSATLDAGVLSLSNWYEQANGQPPVTTCPLMNMDGTWPASSCSAFAQLTVNTPMQMQLQDGTRCTGLPVPATLLSYCTNQELMSWRAVFLTTMLADTRAASATWPAACGQTNVRIHRVGFDGGDAGSSLPPSFMRSALRVQRF